MGQQVLNGNRKRANSVPVSAGIKSATVDDIVMSGS